MDPGSAGALMKNPVTKKAKTDGEFKELIQLVDEEFPQWGPDCHGCRDVLEPHLVRAVSAVKRWKHVEFPRKSVLKEMQFVGKNNLWEITDYGSYSDSSLGVFMQTCMSTPYRHM